MNSKTHREPRSNTETINILLIEDNPADARLIKELLSESSRLPFHIDTVDRLSTGIDSAAKTPYSAVLLDLGLPDSKGLNTFTRMYAAANYLPIVIVSGLADESIRLKALETGAMDYLLKGQIDGDTLWRCIRYAIERERTERQKDLSLKIMGLLNNVSSKTSMIREILMLIQDFSGCEAVGIRIKEGEDYPYYEASGFITGHVELENHLCAYDEAGEIIRDSKGDPVLECMCGNIIRGRFDPALPFFTPGGSFWSNCTTELLASTTEEDRQARTRNRCNGEGYESVALIPLKGENGDIGLLQLNDTRCDRFTIELIRFYEGIAQSIGIVLMRKRAGEALSESEEKYRALVENINDVLYILDSQGNITYISPAVERFTQYKVSDLIGKPFAPLVHPDDISGLLDSFNRLASGHLEPWEFRVLDKDGKIIFVRTSSRPIYKDGQITGFTSLMVDITERKKAEAALRISDQQFREFFEQEPNYCYRISTDGKILDLNSSALQVLGYSSKDQIIGKDVLTTIYSPASRDLAHQLFLRWKETGELKNKELRIITVSGEERTVLLNVNAVRDLEGKLLYSVSVQADITERKASEEKLLKSYETLKKTLNDAINTMVKIVEMRDPYTAGHQNKVADLAVAIAREMKLDDTRVDQLRMSAVIHDVGKMYVPSDILSKPGKLSNIEFDLIKTHSQGGYDIVKSMDLPCSVANTVLQHHERLDGSGYPNGLKGEDTLLEAKILTVADVIEAMASHRPYRPALGIEKALEEISKNKGKIYDPDVVDACLGLFKEQGFKFKE